MLAAPTPPASVGRPDEAVPSIESTSAMLALIGALADGASHPLRTLAAGVLGSGDDESVASLVVVLHALREAGMPIALDADAVRARRFAVLDETKLREALPGWRATVVGATASTNSDLLAEVRSARRSPGPRFLACEFQTAGRGRLGRRWTSAPGTSLTMSVALDVARPIAALDGATLVCGLAVLEVVRAAGVGASLKWPNDVLVGDRKLGGILVEAHAAGSATTVVVGVGVNVERADGRGRAPASGLATTSLVECGASATDRNTLAVGIALALERRLERFADAGFEAFVDEWNAADGWRDRAVVLRAIDGTAAAASRGIARGVDVRGALRLDVAGTVERVISGDLSLRAADAG